MLSISDLSDIDDSEVETIEIDGEVWLLAVSEHVSSEWVLNLRNRG